MQHRAAQVAVSALVVVLGIYGFIELRDATLSRHEHVEPDSEIELVVDVHRHGGNERTHTDAEVVLALIDTCRLEVKSDVAGPLEDLGAGRFRGVLAPSMDPTDRRQFRGCLEDWIIDHLQVDVVRLEEVG